MRPRFRRANSLLAANSIRTAKPLGASGGGAAQNVCCITPTWNAEDHLAPRTERFEMLRREGGAK